MAGDRNRWPVIATYAFAGSANQMLWLTFTPVTTEAARHYGVSVNDIGWLSEIFPLLYVLLAVPAATLLDRHFRPSLAAGVMLTAVGGILRVEGETFLWAMAGQVLIAIAQPLILNAVAGLASAYLTPASRPVGIAIGTAGIFLGMLCSLALGSALGGGNLHVLLVIGAIYGVVSALSLLVALAVSERPVIAGDVTGVRGLTAVWQDRSIRRLAALAFIGFGFFVALITWLQTLLKPAHVPASTAGWLLVAMVVAGVVGAAILPAPIIRAGRARRLFQIAAVVTSGACVLFALWKSVPAIGIAIALSGFFMLACLPVILEIAERRAGSAGISATALIWLSGNAGGVVIALLVQTVVHQPLVGFLLMAAIPVAVLAVVPSSSRLAAEYGEHVA